MAVHPARHANGTKTRGQLHPVADNNRAVILVRRVALVLLLGVAAVLYGWAADRTALEPYYAASVRSMASSWHDFAFGALDPAATVSLDKLPGAFWPQALSARLFGFHGWALVLPVPSQVAQRGVWVPVNPPSSSTSARSDCWYPVPLQAVQSAVSTA